MIPGIIASLALVLWAAAGAAMVGPAVAPPATAVLTVPAGPSWDVTGDGSSNSQSDPSVNTFTQIGNTLTVEPYTHTHMINSTEIAVIENGGTDELKTMTWDGSDFTQSGNAFSLSIANGSKLKTIDENTVVVLDSVGLAAYTWDGADWSAKGNKNASVVTSGTANTDIAVLSPNKVAVVEGGSVDELTVWDFDGTDWTQTGNTFSLNSSTVRPRLTAITATDVAVIDDGQDHLKAYTWDGADWSAKGNAFSVGAFTGHYGLHAMSSGRVAYLDDADRVELLSWDGTDFSVDATSAAFGSLLSSWPRNITRYDDTHIIINSWGDNVLAMIEMSDT